MATKGRHPRSRTIVGAILAVTALATVAPATADDQGYSYRAGDDSLVALNILPPGQGEHLNVAEFAQSQATGLPDHLTDQLGLYESLVAKAPGLANLDGVKDLFKDASFGVAPGDVAATYSPLLRNDVVIVRDKSYNVPHIYGSTREGTMFGAGYASAEDRLFMMDTLRHVARGRLSEFLGASPANLAMDRAQRAVADYTEEELVAMGERVAGLDPVLGPLASADLISFAAGINAYIVEALADPRKLPAEYPALQQVPRPWNPTDSIALATLIGGTFSVGGGGQLANDRFLAALEDDNLPIDAREIFDDFRFANDSEAPVSTDEPHPFNDALGTPTVAPARPDDPSGLVLAMQAGVAPPAIDGPFGPIRLLAQQGASNALLVDAGHSATGNPIAVFGPQVGYWSPEILMEIDLHGPGIDARGAAFPGISLYVLLGRGKGYGWSATTAVGDHIDIRAVKLCEPGGGTATLKSRYYLRDGQCREIHRRTDTWAAKPTAGGIPVNQADPSKTDPGSAVVVSMTTERVQLGDPGGNPYGNDPDLKIGPDWAIVVARGSVNGEPVAFVRQRSSYGIEVDATLTYVKIHDSTKISGMQDLIDAFADYFSFSFNWHLIDGEHIAFYTTGRYPLLKPGIDPDLPFWGEPEYDWTGFLAKADHPQAIDPTKGYITNWNNKQAPLFRASDNWFAYGPVGRMALLEDGVVAALTTGGTVSIAELVQAMGIAATQDVRGKYVLPNILDVIGDSSGLGAKLQDAIAKLASWTAGGAHRRDIYLGDGTTAGGDGKYDEAAAIALMDALWAWRATPTSALVSPILEAAFKPVLGDAFGAVPMGFDNGAGPGGSAYLSGWYGQLQRDLRDVKGDLAGDPFSRLYCGEGSLDACRNALIAALSQAVTFVENRYGTDAANWGVQSLACASAGTTAQACADNLKNKDAIRFSAVGVVNLRPMHWQNRPTFQQVLEFGP